MGGYGSGWVRPADDTVARYATLETERVAMLVSLHLMRGVRASGQTTRTFAAGAFAFEVTTGYARDRSMVEFLFQDLPPATGGENVAPFSLRRVTPSGELWRLAQPGVADQPAGKLAAALVRLMAAVNLGALDAEPGCLHLHAAAATNAGRVAVIAAERNTGKTTTVAHLVARGWGFMTDETVRLSPATSVVQGFPKPISIKPGGLQLVDHLEQWVIPPPGDGATFGFVPMGASGAEVVDGGRPHLVVLLRRPPRGVAEPTSRRLDPADAVVALMQETLDAERFGAAAVRLAELAAMSHCYEVTAGTPEATADHIDALFDSAPVDPMPVTVLPSTEAVSPGVVTVAVGDRVVVHETASGRVFALDEAGAQVWRQIGGWGDMEIDVEGPVVRRFVAQLRALGVLAGGA